MSACIISKSVTEEKFPRENIFSKSKIFDAAGIVQHCPQCGGEVKVNTTHLRSGERGRPVCEFTCLACPRAATVWRDDSDSDPRHYYAVCWHEADGRYRGGPFWVIRETAIAPANL
jgi:hypothetical protein